ncbi:MAG TPA: NAD(P)/FAD-dependent oxidoreductase [Rhizomicrobium sp.]|nr:NAD(P)/FAD-dependent oxidoreductase [Rhizomicrobium sp.]
MSKQSYDAVLIGGGHNGLACAFYLARAGYKVCVLERRGVVGGAAITEEFHPGFRNSVASYSVSLLNPKIIRDMDLARHGLKIVLRTISYFAPLDDGRYLIVDRDKERTAREIGRFSTRDVANYNAYNARLDSIVDLLRSVLMETPPNAGGGLRDLLGALSLGNRVRHLGMQGQRDLVDFFAKSAGDILDYWFETDALKGMLGFDAITGAYASPYTPGTAYVLLHHVFGEVNGLKGAWGHPIGGMGAITQAMAKACAEAGVEIRTDSPVREVVLDRSHASGVVLADGTAIHGRAIVSNVNPKLLYGGLISVSALPADFMERIHKFKCGSGTFRMNVALSELPNFRARPTEAVMDHHGGSMMIAPSLKYLDEAYADARRTGWAQRPVIEMHIQSVLDDSLAPRGQHVASLFCQHVAPELPDGSSWDDHRETFADVVIDTMTKYAPNFRSSVLGRMILSPLDMERKLALVGGDIFHGQLSLDQLYSARPVLGHGDYRGPLKGLYMCGSSTHPGGGVTGLPGHNAAREIIRDFRKGQIPRAA